MWIIGSDADPGVSGGRTGVLDVGVVSVGVTTSVESSVTRDVLSTRIGVPAVVLPADGCTEGANDCETPDIREQRDSSDPEGVKSKLARRMPAPAGKQMDGSPDARDWTNETCELGYEKLASQLGRTESDA